jgi:hypothetical protein
LVLLLAVATAGAEDFTVRFELLPQRGLIVLQGTVNDKPATMILDTGTELTMVDREFLKLDEKKFPKEVRKAREEWAGVWTGRRMKVKELTIGRHQFLEKEIWVVDLGPTSRTLDRKIDAIVGMDALRKFDEVTLSLKKRELRLIKE